MDLVVDTKANTSGIGRQLVAAIESWAKKYGRKVVVVRPKVVRLDSHPFYEQHRYESAKT